MARLGSCNFTIVFNINRRNCTKYYSHVENYDTCFGRNRHGQVNRL